MQRHPHVSHHLALKSDEQKEANHEEEIDGDRNRDNTGGQVTRKVHFGFVRGGTETLGLEDEEDDDDDDDEERN